MLLSQFEGGIWEKIRDAMTKMRKLNHNCLWQTLSQWKPIILVHKDNDLLLQ